jgi:hypothetical protein
VRQHVLEVVRLAQHPGRDVVELRFLAEVEADHLRHVGVDRLVVGDTGADGVGQRDMAGAIGGQQPGTPSIESLLKTSGSRKSSSSRR